MSKLLLCMSSTQSLVILIRSKRSLTNILLQEAQKEEVLKAKMLRYLPHQSPTVSRL